MTLSLFSADGNTNSAMLIFCFVTALYGLVSFEDFALGFMSLISAV
jgi:hypothetical protein